MNTKDGMIHDVSAELDKEFGLPGTLERQKFEDEARDYYTGQILLEARREAKITQSELAQRINSNKAYISKIEHGLVSPSLSVFYRIINALGLRVDIVRPIGQNVTFV